MKNEKEREKKLNKKEKELLLFLYKFRVAEIKTIQIYLNYKNYDSARKILKGLYDHKYLIRYRLNIYEPYEYSLSYKGLHYFGKNGFEYNFISQNKEIHLLHSELVAFVLRDNKTTINNLISQREMLSHYYKKYNGFYHYKLPIFIYEDLDIYFYFMTSQSYNVDLYVSKLKDIIHYQNPNEFIIFNNVFDTDELKEIKKSISKPIYFYELDYIKKDNDFSLNKLRGG